METAAPPVAVAEAASMSPFARLVRIFTRPAQAWAGLETRAQWWFPLLIFVVVNTALTFAIYERAIAPDQSAAYEAMVESGQMSPTAAAQAEQQMSGPTGRMIATISTALMIPILSLLFALALWFGVSFLLGTKFPFRRAFEVATWSSLVTIPGQILATFLAWNQQSMKAVNIGWAALLPESEPSKMMTGVSAFLNALGPFAIWSLVVTILGATALSGAPRKNVAWVVSGLYVLFALAGALLAGMFAPGGAS
jgi:hypothetical protein